MKKTVKQIEKANEKSCEILNDIKFKNKENEIKAIEVLSSFLLSSRKQEIKKVLSESFIHLRKFYKTKKDYEKHLFSGEVKVSIKDVVNILSNNIKTK